LIPLLPAFLKTPLEFLGVTAYLEKSLDKYNKFEDEKKKERQYLEYAKQLEQNRPKSPTKNTKIDFTSAPIEKKSEHPAEGKKVFDPVTK